MSKPEVPVVCPRNQQQWREWLQAHHDQHQSVWLVYYKKTSATPTLSWSEAVDEALCFGWIDSQGWSVGEVAHRSKYWSRYRL
jgi:uncharacterized protein YdeI (YjbR/CyaY-like superfamily)